MLSLHLLALMMLAFAFTAHCREMVMRHNYGRTDKHAIGLFLLDPISVLLGVLCLKDELLATTLGTVAFWGNIGECVFHLLLFGRHFFIRPLPLKWSLVHNSIDATFIGLAAIGAASCVPPQEAMLAGLFGAPAAFFGLPILEGIAQRLAGPRAGALKAA